MKTLNIDSHRINTPSNKLSLGVKTMAIGTYGAYFALAIIYFWFGGMKFTHYEAQGLVPLVSNSPLLGWTYEIFSVDIFSNLLGVLEISIGALIAGRLLSPKLSLIGGALSAPRFPDPAGRRTACRRFRRRGSRDTDGRGHPAFAETR